MEASEVRQKTWDGEHWGRRGTIAHERRRYRRSIGTEDEEPARLSYINKLYSGLARALPEAKRGDPAALGRTAACAFRLKFLLERYQRIANTEYDEQQFEELSPDAKEMLGAIMARYADIPALGGSRYLDAAYNLACSAYGLTEHVKGAHTPALAAITAARVCIARKRAQRGLAYVRAATAMAPGIIDPDQKARVLRSCADLWAGTFAQTDRALALIDEADAVPGIGRDVLAKNAETRRALGL